MLVSSHPSNTEEPVLIPDIGPIRTYLEPLLFGGFVYRFEGVFPSLCSYNIDLCVTQTFRHTS